YVTKPIDEAELSARIRAMLRIARLEKENLTLRTQIEEGVGRTFANVIGKSRAMERVYTLLEKVIDSDTTVLLSGETGTGKEVLAKTIHAESPRSDKPFVAVNCGAMAEQLLESELFGHKKGSFTGASSDRAGLFETANGGVVLLDEIGETSAGLQVRLLRVLQEGEIRRVGEDTDRNVDVRVIAASHRDLQQRVSEGEFREDLYYRLAVFPIELPPLRDRREDIPDLCLHFLSQKRTKEGKGPEGFTAPAMDALGAHDWPGNIRELQNEVERASLFAGDGERIDMEHLSEKLTQGRAAATGPGAKVLREGALKEVLAEVEREMIAAALERHNGNRTHACEELQVSRWGLVQKIKTYGLGS
ncbi:MAG: sigma-54-dependent Fis family transcriptional regulator, partial [Gemmatimonadetes bacterium]|nr:sigma-54-dependent Fis family transcriptional regulator [Gemmatimonadota bacterium]